MRTFDQDGRQLAGLPAGAVRIRSSDTSMVSLVGLYIDTDGIVYNPNGDVNEPATALAARAAVTAEVARRYGGPDPATVEAVSVQEQSGADATAAYVDAQIGNIFDTGGEVVQNVQDVATKVLTGVFSFGPWLVGAWLLYQVAGDSGRTRARSYVRKHVRRARRRAAAYVRG